MQFYIQVNEDGYITDAITYEHEGYIPVTLDVPLPDGFCSGAYKYLGGNGYELDSGKLIEADSHELEQIRANVDYIAMMTGVEL